MQLYWQLIHHNELDARRRQQSERFHVSQLDVMYPQAQLFDVDSYALIWKQLVSTDKTFIPAMEI